MNRLSRTIEQKVSARVPVEEMERLFSLGYHLIPCGGEDGKKPLRSGWNAPKSRRMPLETVFKIMRKHDSCTYGVRLDGLAVVDCDTWDDGTREYVSKRFPEPNARVWTSRGAHLYFGAGQAMPTNLRTAEMSIDFKAGHNHFVIGPGSVRPDGRTYDPDGHPLPPIRELTRFRVINAVGDTPTSALPNVANVVPTQAFTRQLIKIGDRNAALLKHAVSLGHASVSLIELVKDVTLWASIHCDNPQTVTVAEIKKACSSVWRMRQSGKLYASRQSEFRMPRAAFDLINAGAGSGAGNCLLLYSYLVQSHGHTAAKPFAVVSEAIARSKRVALSKSTIDRCKQTLRDLGLIRLLRKGKHMEPDLYMLTPVSQIGNPIPTAQ
ncbi:bifunctional DNA primase/polymerase [Sinorhizobium chiapasense]|uniref:Bifunctional DNA primase/polymerase n=1 Tax=Sinorhizobium chiapasense TaxID=501572 RepID=A0ABZ2BGA1_9HYPH